MSKKRYFDTKFWSDTWVVDSLNPLDRYLFMYLMLNEKTNIAGVYELPLRTMAYEVGLDKEEVMRMLKRLEPKVFYRDGWVVLKNMIKHQNYKNKFIAEGIRSELCKAPQTLLDLVQVPDDMDYDLTCPIQDSSGLLHDSRVIESNLIEFKSNSTQPTAAPKSQGLNKKTYAQAANADRALMKRETLAKQRKPSEGKGYKKAMSIAEAIKQKNATTVHQSQH